LAVLKCLKIREFYEFFKIRKMRILGLCGRLFLATAGLLFSTFFYVYGLQIKFTLQSLNFTHL